ncbi:MAG: hypothetical protein EZS28_032740, partial [Streblomastix strix]
MGQSTGKYKLFAMCATVASKTQSSQSDSSSSQTPRRKVSPRPPATQLRQDEIKIADADYEAGKLDDNPLDYDEMYDEFMNLNRRKVMFNSKVSRIFIIENDELVGEVQHNGIFDESQSSIPFQRFGFESENRQKAQVISICNDLLGEDVQSTSSSVPQRDFESYITRKSFANSGVVIDRNMKAPKRRRLSIDEENDLLAQSSLNQQPHANIGQHIASIEVNQQARNDETRITPIHAAAAISIAIGSQNALQMSFQLYFDKQFKKYAEYESRQEQEASIKLRQMLEGICGIEFQNFDPKSVVISPMEGQILISKVWWKHSNKLWKVPFIAPAAYGERFPIVRNAIKSSGAIQHVFLDLLLNIAIGNTEKLIDQLIDGYKQSVLATSDAQLIREQVAGGVHEKPDRIEIYSDTTKTKMTENRKISQSNFQFPASVARNRSICSGQTRERNKEIVDKQEKQDKEIIKEINLKDGMASMLTTIMIKNQIHSWKGTGEAFLSPNQQNNQKVKCNTTQINVPIQNLLDQSNVIQASDPHQTVKQIMNNRSNTHHLNVLIQNLNLSQYIKPQYIPIKAIPLQQDSKISTSFHILQPIPSTQQNNSSEVPYSSPPYHLIDMKFPIGGRLKQFRNAWQQLVARDIINVGFQATWISS